MVFEGCDFCKNLGIGFRSAFIGVGASKLNSFCARVVKISVSGIDIFFVKCAVAFFRLHWRFLMKNIEGNESKNLIIFV